MAALACWFVVRHGSSFVRVRLGCLVSPWVHPPPHEPIRATDYIELRVLPGYSPYERYVVRIWGDGRIDRSAPDCPIPPEMQRTSIDPGEAIHLISAGQASLCRMCTGYALPGGVFVLDGSVSRLIVSTASLKKSVTVAMGEPDKAYFDLSDRIDKLSEILPLVDYQKFSKERQKTCDLIRMQPAHSPPISDMTLP